MLEYFRRCHNELLPRYGASIAGGFWFAGNTALSASIGFGGTWNEAAAGVVNLAATGVAMLTAARWRHGFPLAVGMATLGMTLQQFPNLQALQFGALAGYTALWISNLPVLAETFGVQDKAQNTLNAFKRAQQSLTQQMLIKPALWYLANSRKVFSVGNSASLLPLIINDLVHGRTHLLPIYGCWLMGNAFSALSRPPESSSAKQKIPAVQPN